MFVIIIIIIFVIIIIISMIIIIIIIITIMINIAIIIIIKLWKLHIVEKYIIIYMIYGVFFCMFSLQSNRIPTSPRACKRREINPNRLQDSDSQTRSI